MILNAPGELPLTAPTRHAPFVCPIEIEYNLTGATLDMHVRLLPETPGSPLINLSPAAPGSEGLSLAWDGGTGFTTIIIQVDEATLEALPAAAEVGDAAVFWYDLLITPSGGTKEPWLRGPFTVEAGVTN